MAEPRASWINFLAGAVGGLVFALGVVGLMDGFAPWDTLVALVGFLVAGWAALDYRRFRTRTAESEVRGGHTIE
jgi:uncharacterized membrane protein required for colicin V production